MKRTFQKFGTHRREKNTKNVYERARRIEFNMISPSLSCITDLVLYKLV